LGKGKATSWLPMPSPGKRDFTAELSLVKRKGKKGSDSAYRGRMRGGRASEAIGLKLVAPFDSGNASMRTVGATTETKT
jgi:hypothetical protein